MQIFDYIRKQRNYYDTQDIPVVEGVDFSQKNTINKIDHYWMDQYIEDATDDVIGKYPFDNIGKYRVLLEARATDFDTKHVEIAPDKPTRKARVGSMIATKAVKRWMKKYGFANFLNNLTFTRSKYGGILAKKTDKGVFVVPWQNLVTDQSDIMSGIRIERHYMTPAELLSMDSWKNKKEAVQTAEEWREKDVAGNDSSDSTETQGNLIEVLEIQGVIPLSQLKEAQALLNDEEYDEEEDDELEFVEAKVILCGADWMREEDNVKHEDGVILYAKEEESTHKYLARNPIVGRGLGEGVVESLFEHQKWHNFTKTEEMRMIAIAGKKLYLSDDPDVLANIFDEGVDHGTVLRVSEGKIFTELNQIPTGVPMHQTIRAELSDSADKITSSFSAKLGEEAKSGTPFRAQYLQNLEASSQFEQYREEIGEFVEEIVTDWVLPEALKELAEDGDIYDTFTPQELELIDAVILEDVFNKELVRRSLKREVVLPEEIQAVVDSVQKELRRTNKRYVENIKEYIKDVEGHVVVHTTDEARNKAVLFESYANVLQLFAPEDPRRNAIIDRIMDTIGITREEVQLYSEEASSIQPNSNPQLQTAQLDRENSTSADVSLTP